MSAEGELKNFYDVLKDDKILDEYKLMVYSSKIPKFIRPYVSKFLNLLGEKRIS